MTAEPAAPATPTLSGPALASDGLGADEVAERRRRGQVNVTPAPPSRTLLEILRANLFTWINGLLFGLFLVVLSVAPAQDATFALVLVANVIVGSVQEVRAKRTLDRLTILNQPRARVVRGGLSQEINATEIVLDDVVDVGPGDQLVVDGEVLVGEGLEVDESLVTGESEAQLRQPGERLLSGSFVAAGSGRYRATAVGPEAYAAQLAEKARRFTLVTSELQNGITRILRVVTIVMVPAALLLVTGQVRSGQAWRSGAQRSVGGLVPMVPEGLVLLTSVAFAVGVIRLGRRQCLVKELPAVEVLARTTVVCLDKTGTLTDGRITVSAVRTVAGADPAEVASALGALAGAEDHPNATLAAIGERHPASSDGWPIEAVVPFSSARKWSGATFGDGRGAWLLGAPEILLAASAAPRVDLRPTAPVGPAPAVPSGPPGAPPTPAPPTGGPLPEGAALEAAVTAEAGRGRRVVLLARAAGLDADGGLPVGLRPCALVVLEEQVRTDAADTVAYFLRQGVELRVISGDNPLTVGSVAARVGVPRADQPVDARHLPDEPGPLADVLAERTVYGRVTPQQKQDMVAALQARGHVVAMTGDGVNDVLALKDADLGIAMGGGTAAARAVARVVLLDGAFSSLPAVVAEGRRVIANVERVANLFITKTVYAVLLAVVIGLLAVPYPFLPRHFTLISAFAIGIPGFFLALGAAHQPARPNFVGRVMRFVAVSGPVVGVGVLVVYGLARSAADETLLQSQTAATLALLGLSLAVLVQIARPLTPTRLVLVAAMGGAAALALVVPGFRDFFALDVPTGRSWLSAGATVAVGALLLLAAHAWMRPEQPVARQPGRAGPEPPPEPARLSRPPS